MKAAALAMALTLLAAVGASDVRAQSRAATLPEPPAAPGEKITPANAAPLKPTATIGPQQGAGSGAPAGALASRVGKGVRYKSVSRVDAVMYDAPSERATKLFAAPQGMPVEVVSVLRNWIKVRDFTGDLAWMLADDLSDRRMVIAREALPVMRQSAPGSGSWFEIERGVVVELIDERETNGMLRVRYIDGTEGYVQASKVWGA